MLREALPSKSSPTVHYIATAQLITPGFSGERSRPALCAAGKRAVLDTVRFCLSLWPYQLSWSSEGYRMEGEAELGSYLSEEEQHKDLNTLETPLFYLQTHPHTFNSS